MDQEAENAEQGAGTGECAVQGGAVGPGFHFLSTDRDEPFICLGSMATELIDFREVLVNRLSGFLGVEVVGAPRDVVDSRTKIGHVRARLTNHGHCQRLDFTRKLRAHLLKRPVRLCGDENTHALREQVRYQRRRGMRLPSARRTLDHRLRRAINALDDPPLSVVHRKRQKVFFVDRDDCTRCGAGF